MRGKFRTELKYGIFPAENSPRGIPPPPGMWVRASGRLFHRVLHQALTELAHKMYRKVLAGIDICSCAIILSRRTCSKMPAVDVTGIALVSLTHAGTHEGHGHKVECCTS